MSYLSNGVHPDPTCSGFEPLPKLSVEGSIPFARSNEFNQLLDLLVPQKSSEERERNERPLSKQVSREVVLIAQAMPNFGCVILAQTPRGVA